MRTYAERRRLSHERELECSQTSLSLALSRKRERERASVFRKRERERAFVFRKWEMEHASVFHKRERASANSPLPLVGEGPGERARCASVFATTEFRKPLSLTLLRG